MTSRPLTATHGHDYKTVTKTDGKYGTGPFPIGVSEWARHYETSMGTGYWGRKDLQWHYR